VRIFVSYASTNRSLVNDLVEDIQDMGHDVWYDQKLEGGQFWWDNILENLRDSELLIFATTPDSLDSYPCKLEYHYADALNRHVLPVVLIQGINYTLLPVLLQQRQIVDYTENDKKAYKALAHAIDALPRNPPYPEIMPESPAVPISPLAHIISKIDAPHLKTAEQQQILEELRQCIEQSQYTSDAQALLERLGQHPSVTTTIQIEIELIINDATTKLQEQVRVQSERPPIPIRHPADVSDWELKGWIKNGEIVYEKRTCSIGTGGLTGMGGMSGLKGLRVTTYITSHRLRFEAEPVIEIFLDEIVSLEKTVNILVPSIKVKSKTQPPYFLTFPSIGDGFLYSDHGEFITFLRDLISKRSR